MRPMAVVPQKRAREDQEDHELHPPKRVPEWSRVKSARDPRIRVGIHSAAERYCPHPRYHPPTHEPDALAVRDEQARLQKDEEEDKRLGSDPFELLLRASTSEQNKPIALILGYVFAGKSAEELNRIKPDLSCVTKLWWTMVKTAGSLSALRCLRYPSIYDTVWLHSVPEKLRLPLSLEHVNARNATTKENLRALLATPRLTSLHVDMQSGVKDRDLTSNTWKGTDLWLPCYISVRPSDPVGQSLVSMTLDGAQRPLSALCGCTSDILPNLRVLNILSCDSFGGGCVSVLADMAPGLKTLALDGCQHAGIGVLADIMVVLPSLHTLSVRGVKLAPSRADILKVHAFSVASPPPPRTRGVTIETDSLDSLLRIRFMLSLLGSVRLDGIVFDVGRPRAQTAPGQSEAAPRVKSRFWREPAHASSGPAKPGPDPVFDASRWHSAPPEYRKYDHEQIAPIALCLKGSSRDFSSFELSAVCSEHVRCGELRLQDVSCGTLQALVAFLPTPPTPCLDALSTLVLHGVDVGNDALLLQKVLGALRSRSRRDGSPLRVLDVRLVPPANKDHRIPLAHLLDSLAGSASHLSVLRLSPVYALDSGSMASLPRLCPGLEELSLHFEEHDTGWGHSETPRREILAMARSLTRLALLRMPVIITKDAEPDEKHIKAFVNSIADKHARTAKGRPRLTHIFRPCTVIVPDPSS